MKNRPAIILVLVLIVGLLLPEAALADFDLPTGFDDELVVEGVSAPTSIAWLPPGEPYEMLVTSKGGELHGWTGTGTDTAVVLLNLSDTVCAGGEMGLLGLAVHPDFAAGERFLYVYYTDKKGRGGCGDSADRANRVSRFTVAGDGSISSDSEEVIINDIPAKNGNHNGGDLQFGLDGLLYISVGDSGADLIDGETQDDNSNARRLSLLNGKILRINPDGSIPPNNPFTGNGTVSCAETGRAPVGKSSVEAEKKNRKAKKRKQRKLKKKRRQQKNADICREIFATGLRNPYRIAFDPDDNAGSQTFLINDVGGGAWEEIDEANTGATDASDYGWNVREGPCPTGETNGCSPNAKFVEPIFAYQHTNGCSVITGGAFVPDSAGWPAPYDNAYFYADLGCNRLFALVDEDIGEIPEAFGVGAGVTHLAFGPDDALYYTKFNSGEIWRIEFTGP